MSKKKMTKEEEKLFEDNVVLLSDRKDSFKQSKARNEVSLQIEQKLKNASHDENFGFWFGEEGQGDVNITGKVSKKLFKAHGGEEEAQNYMSYLLHLISVGTFGITSYVEDAYNMKAIANNETVFAKFPYDETIPKKDLTSEDIIVVTIPFHREEIFVCLESEILS